MPGIRDDEEAAVGFVLCPERHSLADVAGAVEFSHHQQQGFADVESGFNMQAFGSFQHEMNIILLALALYGGAPEETAGVVAGLIHGWTQI